MNHHKTKSAAEKNSAADLVVFCLLIFILVIRASAAFLEVGKATLVDILTLLPGLPSLVNYCESLVPT